MNGKLRYDKNSTFLMFDHIASCGIGGGGLFVFPAFTQERKPPAKSNGKSMARASKIAWRMS